MKSMMRHVPALLKIFLITTSILCSSFILAEADDIESYMAKEENNVIAQVRFMNACEAGDLVQAAKSIKIKPDLVSELNESGESCMMVAGVLESTEGDDNTDKDPIEMVKLLVEAGADVNQRSTEEQHHLPVIGFHIFFFNFKTVEYLLENGANVNIEFAGIGPEGRMVGIFTPLDLFYYASNESHFDKRMPEIEEYKNHMDKTLEILLKYGAKKYVGTEEL